MKTRILFLAIFVPVFVFSQVIENFSDGNFTHNPTWLGDTDKFVVNTDFELQSAATASAVSSIFTFSEAFVNAQWECSVKINYTTSSSNYASVYVVSDNYDISNGCNAYFVKVGGTNDEVSLFLQQGVKKTKIIDGIDKRVDGKSVEIRIKLTRDALGNFELLTKLSTESEFISEGKVENNDIGSSLYFGLFYSNTSSTGNAYFFDDITVSGEKAIDEIPPSCVKANIIESNKLSLLFSERVNVDAISLFLDDEEIEVINKVVSADKKSATIELNKVFEKGNLYQLELADVFDLSGNELVSNIKFVGIVEAIEQGDLSWNEIMFENPEESSEYVEIYNRSNKVIDLSELVITTRKTDGTLNTGNKLTNEALLAPNSYVAFTNKPEKLTNFHHCPDDARLLALALNSLNNSSATIVLCNLEKDEIYDEVTYNTKWHHPLIKNPKGVSLEKINPDLPAQAPSSWHSASSESNYGTPGYQNSQYRELDVENEAKKYVWVEPAIFTPNNDGQDDLCFIRYELPQNAYVANIAILSAVGVNVCKLVNNSLLSAKGFVQWNGRTDKGMIANPGIYIVYFEVFNTATGDKKTKKLPVVVSSR